MRRDRPCSAATLDAGAAAPDFFKFLTMIVISKLSTVMITANAMIVSSVLSMTLAADQIKNPCVMSKLFRHCVE